jgi:hypothetical protein
VNATLERLELEEIPAAARKRAAKAIGIDSTWASVRSSATSISRAARGWNACSRVIREVTGK